MTTHYETSVGAHINTTVCDRAITENTKQSTVPSEVTCKRCRRLMWLAGVQDAPAQSLLPEAGR
jgi:hypothetical protein